MSELTLEKLVLKLSKQYITVGLLRKGDVVVTNHGFWLIETTGVEPNGFISATDEDGNGFVNVPTGDVCIIVDRGCFR